MTIGLIANGTTYTFDNPTYGYITGAEGFGMPAIDRFSERGAQQHGDQDTGYRLNARRVSLVIALPADTESLFYEARQRLLRLFHPSSAITLKVTDDAGLDRRLDVVYESSLSMPMNREWKMQNVVIGLRTSGLPAWYDPTARSATFDAGGGSSSFVVPMVIPHGVGSDSVNANAVLSYQGTWEEYPFVKITGPIANCIITNNTTGEKLDFTGYSLPSGHYLEIDTRFRYKTVLYDGVTNYINKLTADSDIGTFHLAPVEMGETARDNSFTVTGTLATNLTGVQVFYQNRYIGI